MANKINPDTRCILCGHTLEKHTIQLDFLGRRERICRQVVNMEEFCDCFHLLEN